jgi:hypothetical protein
MLRIMSQESRNKQGGGERDISQTSAANDQQKNYEGFEGMNYEQFRQPYNPRHMNRNSSNDERKDHKRPDEG